MRWRRRVSPAVAWSGLALGVVLAFVLIGAAVSAVAPTPSGPTLSSYATTPTGLAAWATLLERDGHAVSQIRRPLASVRLPADGTLVILGGTPVLSVADRRAVTRFVAAGGRLVTADPRLGRSAGPGGRVVGLADPAFLENGALGRGGNAFRALRIAGPPSRPVFFDEVVHGYGPAIGLAALPRRWWFGIVLLVLALAAWALSRAVRLGGSDPVAPPQAGPRTAYVEAMAQTLVRTNPADQLALRVEAVASAEANFQRDSVKMGVG
jgi:hypothetical protein